MSIRTSYEQKRGCGYRKGGGLYLVSGAPGVPCSALPIPLHVCPTCNQGVKQLRSFQWIRPALLGNVKHRLGLSTPQHLEYCVFADMARLGERCGLLWVGEKFYTPEEFTAEAQRMGASRRISAIPKDFEIGTWVLLGHKAAIVALCAGCRGAGTFVEEGSPERHTCEYCKGSGEDASPGIFHAFRPSAIEYVVKGDETPAELDKLERRGASLVNVVPIHDDQPQEVAL